MKKLLFTSVVVMFAIMPAFADNEPTLIPASEPGCNESVLNTTSGSAALEAIYTANTITTQWYTGYGANEQAANPTTCSYDGTINLPATNPTRAGYDFAGWTGTGLTEETMEVVIPTGSTGHRNYTAIFLTTSECYIENISTTSAIWV